MAVSTRRIIHPVCAGEDSGIDLGQSWGEVLPRGTKLPGEGGR